MPFAMTDGRLNSKEREVQRDREARRKEFEESFYHLGESCD